MGGVAVRRGNADADQRAGHCAAVLPHEGGEVHDTPGLQVIAQPVHHRIRRVAGHLLDVARREHLHQVPLLGLVLRPVHVDERPRPEHAGDHVAEAARVVRVEVRAVHEDRARDLRVVDQPSDAGQPHHVAQPPAKRQQAECHRAVHESEPSLLPPRPRRGRPGRAGAAPGHAALASGNRRTTTVASPRSTS